MAERSVWYVLVSMLLACCVGCGSDSGHRVSGKVMFKGQPVPGGKIYFMPDGAKGNQGATGFADIKDGMYDTGATGRGAPAGAVIIAVEGIDPSTVLFARYELAAELPSASSTKDIDVPESAEKGPIQPKEENPVVVP
jgi:hypothetical protein